MKYNQIFQSLKYSLFTQQRNYILSWEEKTICYVFESKNERRYIILLLQKRLGLSYVLYLFARKYFPRTFQEMSSFLIITQKRRHFSSFFPPELGRYTYLGTLLKVDYAD